MLLSKEESASIQPSFGGDHGSKSWRLQLRFWTARAHIFTIGDLGGHRRDHPTFRPPCWLLGLLEVKTQEGRRLESISSPFHLHFSKSKTVPCLIISQIHQLFAWFADPRSKGFDFLVPLEPSRPHGKHDPRRSRPNLQGRGICSIPLVPWISMDAGGLMSIP